MCATTVRRVSHEMTISRDIYRFTLKKKTIRSPYRRKSLFLFTVRWVCHPILINDIWNFILVRKFSVLVSLTTYAKKIMLYVNIFNMTIHTWYCTNHHIIIFDIGEGYQPHLIICEHFAAALRGLLWWPKRFCIYFSVYSLWVSP